MTGTVNVFIPRLPNGDLMTGNVPKGQRTRAKFTPRTDVRTFFDPLADYNLPNAIPLPKPRPMPKFAPKGWRLAPAVEVVAAAPVFEVAAAVAPVSVPHAPTGSTERPACPTCGRSAFRANGIGYRWHLANAHLRVTVGA